MAPGSGGPALRASARVGRRRPRPGVARNLDQGTVLAERLETASSFWGKFLGLMGRPSLSAGDGLWLPGGNGIHMMFMRFPIDAVFLSKADAAGVAREVGASAPAGVDRDRVAGAGR